MLRPSIGAGAVLVRAVRAVGLRRRVAHALRRADARDLPAVPRAVRPRARPRCSGSCSSLLTAFVLIARGARSRRGRVVAQAAGRPARRARRAGRAGAGPRSPSPASWCALALRAAGRRCSSSWAARGRGTDARRSASWRRWPATRCSSAPLAAVAAVVAALPVAWLSARHARPLAARCSSGRRTPPTRCRGSSSRCRSCSSRRAWPTPLYQTLALLVFAYVVRFLPQALGGARGGDPARSTRDSRRPPAAWGRRRAQVLRAGHARRSWRPGLLAGATLVFLSTMKELPVTLLLRPIGFDTLATEVWSATGGRVLLAGRAAGAGARRCSPRRWSTSCRSAPRRGGPRIVSPGVVTLLLQPRKRSTSTSASSSRS